MTKWIKCDRVSSWLAIASEQASVTRAPYLIQVRFVRIARDSFGRAATDLPDRSLKWHSQALVSHLWKRPITQPNTLYGCYPPCNCARERATKADPLWSIREREKPLRAESYLLYYAARSGNSLSRERGLYMYNTCKRNLIIAQLSGQTCDCITLCSYY